MENKNKRSEYDNNYKKENYDSFVVRLPKGKKSQIDERVKDLKITRMEYIRKLIQDDFLQNGIEWDNKKQR